MVHRSDSDWHGWPLQAVTEQVAQKQYADMRSRWPDAVQEHTPALLSEADPNVKRQIMEVVLPYVTDVLDVVNAMPHPVVSELQAVLTEHEVRSPSDISAPYDAVDQIREIVSRYTQEEA